MLYSRNLLEGYFNSVSCIDSLQVKDVPGEMDLHQVRSVLSGVSVPEFVPASNKRIVTDESVGRGEAEMEEEEEGGEGGDNQRLLALIEGAKCKVGLSDA